MEREFHEFDRALKEILRELPKRFAEVIFNAKVSEVLDPSFPRVKERIVDFAGRLSDGRIVLVEILSGRVKDLVIRLADIYLRGYEKYREPPQIIVLWVSEEKCPYEDELKLGSLTLQVTVKDLKEISCEELLKSDDPNDLLFAVLCKTKGDVWERIKDIVFSLSHEDRRDYLTKLGILVRLRSNVALEFDKLIKEVDDMYVKIDVKKDPLYRRGYLEGLTVIRKKWIERGMKRGFEKGSIVQAQQYVLDVLAERFGFVDEDIKKTLKSINDKGKLRRLHRLSVKCQTLTEFKDALKRIRRILSSKSY